MDVFYVLYRVNIGKFGELLLEYFYILMHILLELSYSCNCVSVGLFIITFEIL